MSAGDLVWRPVPGDPGRVRRGGDIVAAMRASIYALGLLMFACGGDEGTTASESSGTSGADAGSTTTPTSTGGGELAGCDCFEYDNVQVKVLCPQPSTCDVITGECLDDETNCVPADEAALDCAIAAIQADTIGEVGWSTTLTFSDENEFYTSDRTLRVFNFGTGQVFWTGELSTGLTTETGGVRRFELASLNLAECAAIAAAPARFDCLRAAFAGPPAEVCIEASMVF
jgi:hypothetical protein